MPGVSLLRGQPEGEKSANASWTTPTGDEQSQQDSGDQRWTSGHMPLVVTAALLTTVVCICLVLAARLACRSTWCNNWCCCCCGHRGVDRRRSSMAFALRLFHAAVAANRYRPSLPTLATGAFATEESRDHSLEMDEAEHVRQLREVFYRFHRQSSPAVLPVERRYVPEQPIIE